MAKTIKVIDLIEMFYKKEKMPQRIKVSCYKFEYDEEINAYFNLDKTSDNRSLIQDWLNNAGKLNNTVEIIEEQQDINIQEIEEIKFRESDNEYLGFGVDLAHSKINELVQAVKQLDKNIKDKE